jgi:Putative beta-barrel porin 2
MLTASGAGQYESQDNIYDLPAGVVVPSTNDTRHGDNITTYTGILQTSYGWRQDSVYLDLNGSDLRYDRLSYLDHTEYAFDGGLKWALDGNAVNGTIDVSRSRSAVPFYTLIQQQQQVVLMTQQRELATLSFLMTPDWRISTDVHKSNVDAPVAGANNLSNSETGGGLQLTYVRAAKLTGGIAASYSTGDYGGVAAALATSYRQETLDLTSTYTVTARTAFSGQVGYTRRLSDSNSDSTSGVSGSLNYRRTLTSKTSINLLVSRAVASNITNTSAELDTIASVNVNYAATYKMTLQAGYNVTKRYLPGQGIPIGTDRNDRQQFATFGMDYQWLRWLSIRAYANYQTRSSDAAGADFNATVYGITATATWRHPRN